MVLTCGGSDVTLPRSCTAGPCGSKKARAHTHTHTHTSQKQTQPTWELLRSPLDHQPLIGNREWEGSKKGGFAIVG